MTFGSQPPARANYLRQALGRPMGGFGNVQRPPGNTMPVQPGQPTFPVPGSGREDPFVGGPQMPIAPPGQPSRPVMPGTPNGSTGPQPGNGPQPNQNAYNNANPNARFMRASGQAPTGGAGFNPYAAGNKQFGASPNMGPMRDKTPFQERDQNAMTQRNALLRRLKDRQAGNYGSSANLGYQQM